VWAAFLRRTPVAAYRGFAREGARVLARPGSCCCRTACDSDALHFRDGCPARRPRNPRAATEPLAERRAESPVGAQSRALSRIQDVWELFWQSSPVTWGGAGPRGRRWCGRCRTHRRPGGVGDEVIEARRSLRSVHRPSCWPTSGFRLDPRTARVFRPEDRGSGPSRPSCPRASLTLVLRREIVP
jgi:hypothetical protein